MNLTLALLDWLMILALFSGCMAIVVVSTRRVKSKSDYLLAGQKLGKWPTAFSTAATDFGGSGLIGAAGLAYSVGIAGSWWDLAAVPAWIILGMTLAVGFRKLSLYTVPEFLGKRYNETSRTIASITHILSLAFNTTAQLTVSSLVINAVAGIDMRLALVISMLVVLCFSCLGGLITVAWTDSLQYVILMLGVILATPLSIHAAGGWNNIVDTVPASYWDMGALGFSEPFGWGVMCFYGYAVSQSFVQRLLAAKDTSTARFAYLYTGINYLFYSFAVALLGICAFVIVPGLSNPEMAIPEIIVRVLPAGIRGLVLASIFSATISTATSNLNASASLFTVDIYQHLIRKEADDRHYLKVARLSTVAVAAIALLTSFFSPNLIWIILLSNLVYSAGIFFPVVVGMYWKRVNGSGALAAILAGGSSALLCNFFVYGQVTWWLGRIHPMVTGSLVSLLVLVIVSLLTPPPGEEHLRFLSGSAHE